MLKSHSSCDHGRKAEAAGLGAVAPAPLAVDTDEAAHLLGFSPKTLANWRARGVGPAYVRTGAQRSPVVYMTDDLKAWLVAHRVDTKA